jgi:hypothetical protein
MKLILIYCAGNNKHLAEIAINAGFKFGVRPPCSIFYPIYFADQDWKKPNRSVYMRTIEKHKPEIATVLDWEREDQFAEVMDWAEEITQYVNKVIIIPKVIGEVNRVPYKINGKDVILGYSVKSRYGSTPNPYWEFTDRQIHLLGGSPYRQYEAYLCLRNFADVVSLDCNYHQMKAMRFCEHWEYPNQWIPDGGKTEKEAHFAAFETSCKNIIKFWNILYNLLPYSMRISSSFS